MKHVLSCILGLFFLSLGSVFCGAQNCTNGFDYWHYHCDGPDGCSDDVEVSIPDGGEYGVAIQCGSVSCCGQLFSSCYSNGGNCDMVKALREPAMHERLERLAARSVLLVADCTGRYALYKPARIEERRNASFALLDDRLLR
jgi:hypothetical protein